MKFISVIFLFLFSAFPIRADLLCNIVLSSSYHAMAIKDLLGHPLTFEKSVSFALSVLKEGSVRSQFIVDINEFLRLDQSRVKNRRGLISLVGKNKLSENKIVWKVRVPKNEEEAYVIILDAIEMIESLKIPPLRRLSVYFLERETYLAEFLEVAQHFMMMQGDLLWASDSGKSLIPRDSRARMLFSRFFNLFKNLIWNKDYNGLKTLRLTTETEKIILEGQSLKAALEPRFKFDISLQWYLIHLRNIKTAGALALLSVLVPEVTGSYFHEKELDQLQERQINKDDTVFANQVLSSSEDELKRMIRDSLAQTKTPIPESEREFLQEVQSALTEPTPKR